MATDALFGRPRDGAVPGKKLSDCSKVIQQVQFLMPSSFLSSSLFLSLSLCQRDSLFCLFGSLSLFSSLYFSLFLFLFFVSSLFRCRVSSRKKEGEIDIMQMPVVMIPVHFDRALMETASIMHSFVLRPFLTSDFMTGTAALPGRDIPEEVGDAWVL